MLPPEIEWLGENEEHNHLGKAILLKFFQHEGNFLKVEQKFHPLPLSILTLKWDYPQKIYRITNGKVDEQRGHKRAIRELYGFRCATVVDQDELRNWLVEEILTHEHGGFCKTPRKGALRD